MIRSYWVSQLGTERPIRRGDKRSAPMDLHAITPAAALPHMHTWLSALQLISVMMPPTALRLLLWAFGLNFSSAVPTWFENISTNLFNLSGDIMLGGLFPINVLTSNLTQRTVPDNISCQR